MATAEVVTGNKNLLNELKKKLNASQFRQATLEKLLEAVNGMLAAPEYEDKILIDSSTNSLFEALRVTCKDLIEEVLKLAKAMRGAVRNVWDEVDGCVYDNPDDLRRDIESIIDKPFAAMIKIREEGVKKLEEFGYPVDNADQLETGILEWQTWKQGVFQGWPSSNKVPSPLNREALAEVRAASAQGQKGLTKEAFIESSKTKTRPGD